MISRQNGARWFVNVPEIKLKIGIFWHVALCSVVKCTDASGDSSASIFRVRNYTASRRNEDFKPSL